MGNPVWPHVFPVWFLLSILACLQLYGWFVNFFFFLCGFLVLGLYLLLCYAVRCYVVFFLGGNKGAYSVFFPTHAIVVGTGRLPLGRKGA